MVTYWGHGFCMKSAIKVSVIIPEELLGQNSTWNYFSYFMPSMFLSQELVPGLSLHQCVCFHIIAIQCLKNKLYLLIKPRKDVCPFMAPLLNVLLCKGAHNGPLQRTSSVRCEGWRIIVWSGMD